MSDVVYVVRSESDGGAPGYEFDAYRDAEMRAADLNEIPGLPDDHRVCEEVREQ